MTSPILQVEKVFKSFAGLKAISNLEMIVNEGEIIGIIGPNGSGKTTLLNLITGALRCDSGEIRFKGKDITRVSRERRCVKGINRTFQSSRPFPKMTVLQNVMVGRYYGRNPARSNHAATSESEAIIDFIGLREKKDIPAHNLGMAELKRLEMARALAANPLLLLLDEPMAGLNQNEIHEATETIREIRRRGITVLLVEHIIKAVMGLSDRIVVLNVGVKIAEGLPQEVARNELVIQAYLGERFRARD